MLFLAIFLVGLLLAGDARASQFGDVLDGPIGGWLLLVCVLVGLSLFGALCRQGSRYLSERTHASKVTRLMDVLASQADGIAGMLVAHPPAPGDTLQIVRQAAIAQSIAYAKLNLPETIAQIGASDGVMATRLENFVAQKTLAVVAAAVRAVLSEGAQPAALPAA